MGGSGGAGGVLVLPKRSDSGIQKAARTTSLWLECPLESLSRKILLHFHFSMRDTRSYSLNETHFAWVPRAVPSIVRDSYKSKVVPRIVEDSQMSKVVPRIVGGFRIDPDRPHGPEFESERVGDGHVEEYGTADW